MFYILKQYLKNIYFAFTIFYIDLNLTTILILPYKLTTEQMKDYKLERKRKVSVDDEKKSNKRKTTEENSLVNSSSSNYRENQIDLDLTSLNFLKEDKASTSYYCRLANLQNHLPKKIPIL